MQLETCSCHSHFYLNQLMNGKYYNIKILYYVELLTWTLSKVAMCHLLGVMRSTLIAKLKVPVPQTMIMQISKYSPSTTLYTDFSTASFSTVYIVEAVNYYSYWKVRKFTWNFASWSTEVIRTITHRSHCYRRAVTSILARIDITFSNDGHITELSRVTSWAGTGVVINTDSIITRKITQEHYKN